MIALGIDPGTTRIGYGLVEHHGSRLIALEYGIIENPGQDKFQDFIETEKGLSKIIEKFQPDTAGIERLFFTKNQKTAMAVSEMRGVLLLTLAKHRLPVQEFTPLQVKQSISAYGKADKRQVQKMVEMLLGITTPISPDDAADALAIAICCTHTILPV
ncbi:MAG TPA: crossover junction endodeoxyribonuclease RuvC [Candidatus Paceibacterota bacterium]|nr:crossover junction endodeoxyribonuclease RuvC [Candidatus Paceibacterota bacterium]